MELAIESDPYQRVATLAAGAQRWTDNKARNKLTRYRVQSCKVLCSDWSEIIYRP